MKLRHLDKHDNWKGRLVGVGAMNVPFKSVQCMWEILQTTTNDHLIMFCPHCRYIDNCEDYVQKRIDREMDFEAFIQKSTLIQSVSYYSYQSFQYCIFVLESCPPIKLPYILQQAFPDAYFAWKPFEQW